MPSVRTVALAKARVRQKYYSQKYYSQTRAKQRKFQNSTPPPQQHTPQTPPAVIDAIDVASEAATEWVKASPVIEGRFLCQDIAIHFKHCSAPRTGLNLCTTHRVAVEGEERGQAVGQTDKKTERTMLVPSDALNEQRSEFESQRYQVFWKAFKLL